jgi:hypothetical protein
MPGGWKFAEDEELREYALVKPPPVDPESLTPAERRRMNRPPVVIDDPALGKRLADALGDMRKSIPNYEYLGYLIYHIPSGTILRTLGGEPGEHERMIADMLDAGCQILEGFP